MAMLTGAVCVHVGVGDVVVFVVLVVIGAVVAIALGAIVGCWFRESRINFVRPFVGLCSKYAFVRRLPTHKSLAIHSGRQDYLVDVAGGCRR